MLIFRYENETGMGPYCDSALCDLLSEDVHTSRHMSPYDPTFVLDGRIVSVFELARTQHGIDNEQLRFGCTSMDALHEWFAGATDTLEDHGYQVVCYEAPSEAAIVFTMGIAQVAYDHERAVMVSEDAFAA